MLTIFLHMMIFPFILISAAETYINWKKGRFKKKTIKLLFLFFAFLAAYLLALTLPYLLSGGNLRLMSLGYTLATAFLFLAIVPMVELEMVFTGAARLKSDLVRSAFVIVGLAVIGLQLIYFREPIIHESGFIFWNANPISAWLTSLTGFAVGLMIIAQIVLRWPRDLGTAEKIKSFLFCLGAASLAISGLLYYPSHNFYQTVIVFVTGFLGSLLLTIAVLFPGRKQEGA
jgi:hypothetical protein